MTGSRSTEEAALVPLPFRQLDTRRSGSRHMRASLATLHIIHSAVQKENEELRTELARAQPPGSATDEDLAELKEEFSRRLGSADQTIARLQASLSTATIISMHRLYHRHLDVSVSMLILLLYRMRRSVSRPKLLQQVRAAQQTPVKWWTSTPSLQACRSAACSDHQVLTSLHVSLLSALCALNISSSRAAFDQGIITHCDKSPITHTAVLLSK